MTLFSLFCLIPLLTLVHCQNYTESLFQSTPPTHKIYTGAQAKFHGQTMTSAFSCILQLSILLQRHFKSFKYTSFIHGFLGCCTCALVLFSFYTFYQNLYLPDKDLNEKGRIHLHLGFTICSLITLQVFLGVLTKYLILYKKRMYLLLLTRKVHHLLGWAIAVAGFVNVHLGWAISHDKEVKEYIYPAYGVLGFVLIFSEVFRRRKVRRRPAPALVRVSTDSEQNSELLGCQMSYSEFLKEIRKNSKKWVFYNDLVLNVSSFISSHPGGSYLIEGIIGEDSAKYLYGVTNFSKEIPPNIHSAYALKLSKNFAFSKVSLPNSVICSRSSSPIPLKTSWKVLQTVQLSSTMTLIEFHSPDLFINPSYGYEWMGFHFRVKCNSLKRFYSLVVVNLAKWSLEVKDSNLKAHLSDYQNSVFVEEETLKIYVKRYKHGNVSKYLSGMKAGDEACFKGPYGPGLGICKLPKGQCLAFVAGTGVLVALDLVYAVWRGVRKEFKLCLYASFACREDAVGLDLLEATHKRCKDKMKLQINLDREKIGVRLTKENVKPWISEDLKMVWVCGPAGFNRFIQEILIGYGVNKSNIVIM